MQTKLTLRLEADLIEAGKAAAREAGKSLSQFVAEYFAALDSQTQAHDPEALSPEVRQLQGIIKGPVPEDYQSEYYEWQASKHQ